MNAAVKHFKVRVRAGAARDRIFKKGNDSFVISVRELAVRGQANKSILELLRAYFGPRCRVKIVRGHHSPSKIFSVQELS